MRGAANENVFGVDKEKMTIKFVKFNSARLAIAYKYTNAEYGLRNIENGELYFSNPSVFNDIYDSRFVLKRKDIKNMIYDEAVHNIVLETLYSSEFEQDNDLLNNIRQIKIEKNKSIEEVLNTIPVYFETICDIIMKNVKGQYVYCRNKAACLSERKDSLSMWAYYADNYKGVCLEYSLEKDERLYEHCYKVQYADTRFNFDRTNSGIYYHKSREWEHEQEWRIVADIGEENTLQTNCITAVYLGINISDENKEKIISAANNKGIDVYRCLANEERYMIDFEKIN